LGVLGALDPYRYKTNQGQIDTQAQSTTGGKLGKGKEGGEELGETSASEMLIHSTASSLEEFYPKVAVTALMRIIRDPTLAQHHTMVVQVSDGGGYRAHQ